MRKFIPSFIFAFAIAVSFSVPVSKVLAEKSPTFRASIVTILSGKEQTSNYSYVCPKVVSVQPSFFARLLASVGITQPLPTLKLAESTCGEPDLVKREINSTYVCTPVNYLSPEDNITIKVGCNERYLKSDKKIFSARWATAYGITSCTQAHTYIFQPAFPRSAVGFIKNSCTGPKALPETTTKVNYPPEIDVDGLGSFSRRQLVGTNLAENLSVTEVVQTSLRVSSLPSVNVAVNVPISVALTKLVFNTKTNEFDHVSVPCTEITIRGTRKQLDKNCQTTVAVNANIPVGIDVTPIAPATYYTYSVFVNGAITEK